MREISTSNRGRQKFNSILIVFGLLSFPAFIPLLGFWNTFVIWSIFYFANQFVVLNFKTRLIDRGQSDSAWWEYKHLAVSYIALLFCSGIFISLFIFGFDLNMIAKFILLAVPLGILFPLSMFIFVYFHYWKVRAKKPSYLELLLGSHQNVVLNMNCRYDDAFELCKSRIKARTKYRILQECEELGLMRIGSGIPFGARDSLITLLISKESDDRSKLIILSRPVIDIGALDNGGNIDIVRELTMALTSDEIELLSNG